MEADFKTGVKLGCRSAAKLHKPSNEKRSLVRVVVYVDIARQGDVWHNRDRGKKANNQQNRLFRKLA